MKFNAIINVRSLSCFQYANGKELYYYRKRYRQITQFIHISKPTVINEFGEIYTPTIPILITLN